MYFRKVPTLFQQLYKNAIWSSEGQPQLKWTFDDGPHPESTPRILELLEKYGIKATFFCLGANAEKHHHLIQDILDQGHQLGSHGYNHLSGWSTTKAAYLDNIRLAQVQLQTNLYRPPYGRMTRSQYAAINQELGLRVVMWDRMPGDFDTARSKEDIAQFLKSTIVQNSLIVLHDRPDCLSKISYGLSRYMAHLSVKA